MSAKETAIRNIKESLKVQGKCFLAFHRELNPVMDELVKNQINSKDYASQVQNR